MVRSVQHCTSLTGRTIARLGTFDLAQDYEFAVCVAAVEPLLLIPDYLYYYRWHKKTQSASELGGQIAARDRAREDFSLTHLEISNPAARHKANRPAN
jgi:hypothetical protein